MKQTIREECTACQGTGLYRGMGERAGVAVECHDCDGTGAIHHEYVPFTQRHPPTTPVQRVIKVNPGVVVAADCDIGGIDYETWVRTGTFPPGSEMRHYTCPAWWYQSADYARKPKWTECTWGMFSTCPSFKTKAACWARFDREEGR